MYRKVNTSSSSSRVLNKLSDEQYSNLIEVLDEQGKKLDSVKSDLNSNAFIAMFTTKGKERILSVFKFSITLFIMIGIYVGLYFGFYQDKNGFDRTLDIFGNGLYWVVAISMYIFVSKIIDKKRGASLCKQIKFKTLKK